MVVVLPAPLGPTKPTTCPDEKANETSSTARVGPKCFFRLTTSIFIFHLLGKSSASGPRLRVFGIGRVEKAAQPRSACATIAADFHSSRASQRDMNDSSEAPGC